MLWIACTEKVAEEESIAFSLSDKMMEESGFAQAVLTDVEDELRLFGKITADNNKLAQVFPIAGGVVMSIEIELGDYVRQGQILATIRSSKVARYQKERMDAINDVVAAEKNLQVARDLFAGRLNSEKDVALAEKDLEQARAELRRMDDIFKIYNLGEDATYNITAPISGFVIQKRINRNEQIRSDMEEPLFAIADIEEVWALANVNESDIPRVRVGYEAYIRTIAFPDKEYRGSIDKIFNAIDPESKSMKVRVKIPNHDLLLKPEMNCAVSVRFKENRQLISVPSGAIVFDRSKYWVMVFRSRTDIETRQVEVDREMGNTTYIISGLKEGETVVTKNALLIYDALND